MRALENDLKTRLFVRRPHTLELTRAGQVLRQAAVKMLGEAEALPDRVNRGARGEIGTLRIGLADSTAFNPFIPAAIQAYRQIRPGIDLVLSDGDSQDLCDSLSDGRLDAAFMRPMQVPCATLDSGRESAAGRASSCHYRSWGITLMINWRSPTDSGATWWQRGYQCPSPQAVPTRYCRGGASPEIAKEPTLRSR
jgi:DNA-binding transcriptional LysR family regulator